VVVLSKAGDQVPVYPLREVVGKAVNVPPSHIGATAVNVGRIFGFTVMVRVALIAHWPAVGVKVYVVVAVLSKAGDQEPVIALPEIVGNAAILAPLHTGLIAVKVGSKFLAIFTVTLTKQPLSSVYVMEVIPAVSPVTNPVALTVATAVSDEVQGFKVLGTPEPISCDVPPMQKVRVPVMVGLILTMMVNVVGRAHCPAEGVNV
jgi:hypothetical protein